MKSIPNIIVQLVHIEGPLKGKIQEFSESPITIGRMPTCSLCFPKDLALVSREHAKIIREGNRFKLIDQSANGTYVNGKQANEVYLKDGDVLTFATDGPKVGFLTKQKEMTNEIGEKSSTGLLKESKITRIEEPPREHAPPEQQLEKAIPVQPVQTPLIIQYGPTLRAFKELPVTLGRNPNCDFTIDHNAIRDQHGQFFFHQDHYWVKDLTGQNLISINGQPIDFQAPLRPQNILALSPQGPVFQFLGEGRLAEYQESQEPAPEKSMSAPLEKKEVPSEVEQRDKNPRKKKSLFGKLWQR
jgi:pSer/pThr/pTyr-binding forkhead associated (FHA) protein